MTDSLMRPKPPNSMSWDRGPIGAHLVSRRIDMSLSQTWMAKRANVYQSTLAKMERGLKHANGSLQIPARDTFIHILTRGYSFQPEMVDYLCQQVGYAPPSFTNATVADFRVIRQALANKGRVER